MTQQLIYNVEGESLVHKQAVASARKAFKFSTRLLLTGVLWAGVTVQVFAADAALQAGQYDALMLAITPDRQLQGYYSETLGGGVTRHCAFYLQGRIQGEAPVPVTTWSSEAYPGSVTATADGVELTVERGREHAGCVSVLMPEITTGLALSRYANKPWIGLVSITADKAYLQKHPGDKVAKGPYIVKGDVLGVLAYQAGWARVEFINDDGRSFTGWVREDQYKRPMLREGLASEEAGAGRAAVAP
ncbi:hypothetical protein [Pseudomonas sp. PSKL.D1]|uniref:hypothetical protein n=1 Tax=Pseudomonas sp. PSKL.D1 TaxID=3029060 RepID=UPI0023812306|nr:hypothetical protein [Pseudomonas sp. PSKL.D1]WDY55883.1 hypothetical protein PVV54_14865 [Pseudomonas sp. PSKL.D1]